MGTEINRANGTRQASILPDSEPTTYFGCFHAAKCNLFPFGSMIYACEPWSASQKPDEQAQRAHLGTAAIPLPCLVGAPFRAFAAPKWLRPRRRARPVDVNHRRSRPEGRCLLRRQSQDAPKPNPNPGLPALSAALERQADSIRRMIRRNRTADHSRPAHR